MSKKTKKAHEESTEMPFEGTQQDQNQNNATKENEIESKEGDHGTSNEPSPEDALALEKDRYLRLFAEFENYKRRTSKERIELFKTASHDVMVALLPVLDDFDRAIKELEKSDDALFEGVALIRNKFFETLKQKGLALIDTQAGTTFDADLHEAITQIPAPTQDMKGKIIDVIEKGYMLGEKIIRYPKVVIGQ
ncbi:nucleotide exchange factor GrpE [Flavobacteriaceae bacterium]|nr:nucleotide exchange factor GrpE [Flavobacteriaceae bacterium]